MEELPILLAFPLRFHPAILPQGLKAPLRLGCVTQASGLLYLKRAGRAAQALGLLYLNKEEGPRLAGLIPDHELQCLCAYGGGVLFATPRVERKSLT